MLGLMVMLDVRLVSSAAPSAPCAAVGGEAAVSVAADGCKRACCAGSSGTDMASAGRERWGASAGALAEACACIDCTGEPGCVGCCDLGAGWRLDIVRSFELALAARV
jgi:hypothetical protein